MTKTYLSFTVYGELFATDVGRVLEVLQTEHITAIPNAPAYVKGIINFRGEVVPVIESRIKFGLPEREPEKAFAIIVFDLSGEHESYRTGVIVDRVNDVLEIDTEEIKPVPSMAGGFEAGYLDGFFKLDEKYILLLNTDRIFTNAEIAAISESKTEDLKCI